MLPLERLLLLSAKLSIQHWTSLWKQREKTPGKVPFVILHITTQLKSKNAENPAGTSQTSWDNWTTQLTRAKRVILVMLQSKVRRSENDRVKTTFPCWIQKSGGETPQEQPCRLSEVSGSSAADCLNNVLNRDTEINLCATTFKTIKIRLKRCGSGEIPHWSTTSQAKELQTCKSVTSLRRGFKHVWLTAATTERWHRNTECKRRWMYRTPRTRAASLLPRFVLWILNTVSRNPRDQKAPDPVIRLLSFLSGTFESHRPC